MTPEEIRLHAEDRKRLSGSYKQVFDEISAILFRHDPIGINFQENTDEYDAEVATILTQLRSDMLIEEATGIVHEEFIRWFSREDAGPREKCSPIAAEILSSYNHSHLRQGAPPRNRLQVLVSTTDRK
jgi:hypothetical protein